MIAEHINRLIVEDVNDALSAHNGSCKLDSVVESEDFVMITVDYQGTCVGCGIKSSTTHFIQAYLTEELKELGYDKRVYVLTPDMAEEMLGFLEERLEESSNEYSANVCAGDPTELLGSDVSGSNTSGSSD